jgi:hypothetical protein
MDRWNTDTVKLVLMGFCYMVFQRSPCAFGYYFQLRGRVGQEFPERWLSREHAFNGADRGYSGKLSPHSAIIKPTREAFPTVPRAPIASRASFWSPVPHLMRIASSQLPRFRAVFTALLAIPLSPWRTESETVLGLSWVAVVGVLRDVSRLMV